MHYLVSYRLETSITYAPIAQEFSRYTRLVVTSRQVNACLAVRLSHVFPEHGAGAPYIIGLTPQFITNNCRIPFGMEKPTLSNDNGIQQTTKTKVVMNSNATFALVFLCFATVLLVVVRGADVAAPGMSSNVLITFTFINIFEAPESG